MLYKLSEVVSISSFLQNWSGYQTSNIRTYNSKLVTFHTYGIDSDLNITIMKIIKKYDPKSFINILDIGFSIKYQSVNISFVKNTSSIKILAKLDNGFMCGSVEYSLCGKLNHISDFKNKDVLSLIEDFFKDFNYSRFNMLSTFDNSMFEKPVINNRVIITKSLNSLSDFDDIENELKKYDEIDELINSLDIE